MPVREKGTRRAGSWPARPVLWSRPGSHPGERRAFAAPTMKGAGETDSPAEGTGFEPSVPRQEKWSMPSSSDQTRVGRTLTLGGGAEFSLEGRDIELSVSPKDIPTSPYDLCANRSDRRQSREGTDGSNPLPSSRQSVSLRNWPPLVRKLPFSAGVRAGAGGAVGRDAQCPANIRSSDGIISGGPYSSTAMPPDVVRNSAGTSPHARSGCL